MQLGQFARSVGLLGGGLDNGVDFSDEEVEDRRVEDVLDEEVALGAIEVELVGGEAAHGNGPLVGGLVKVGLMYGFTDGGNKHGDMLY